MQIQHSLGTHLEIGDRNFFHAGDEWSSAMRADSREFEQFLVHSCLPLSAVFSSESSADGTNPSCWFCSSDRSYVRIFHFRSDMLPTNSRNEFPDGSSRVMVIACVTGSSFESFLFSCVSFPSSPSPSSAMICLRPSTISWILA